MFSRGFWLDAAEANKPGVFQEQIRSPVAGRWRHVDETVSCTEMLLVFQGVSFPPPEQPLNARQARDSISAIQGAVSSDTAVSAKRAPSQQCDWALGEAERRRQLRQEQRLPKDKAHVAKGARD